jgi:hypothetical protein
MIKLYGQLQYRKEQLTVVNELLRLTVRFVLFCFFLLPPPALMTLCIAAIAVTSSSMLFSLLPFLHFP